MSQIAILWNCDLSNQEKQMQVPVLSVPWPLRLRNRAAAATCGRGRYELPAIFCVTAKIAG